MRRTAAKPATKEAPKPTAKDKFIRQLAQFLAGDQAKKSIELEMGKESAKEWAALRGTTPLFGYPSVEEAEATLREFLL